MTRPTMPERFWRHVDKRGPDECWPWTAHRDKNGYGNSSLHQKAFRAHRLAFYLETGTMPPPDMCVCHRCDNPPCCNPAHLFLGTNADNTRDRDQKGRTARGDRSGSRLHPERLARGDRSPARIPGARQGTKNGKARLTEAQVVEIRETFARRQAGHSELGRQYGLTPQGIFSIVRGITWKHIGGPVAT
jgi:hypothetical protein